MDREIKFRAWDGEYMYFMHDDDFSIHKGRVVTHEGDNATYQDNWELMEYTGLKDKTESDIYFDDILKHKCGIIALVEWHNGMCAFYDKVWRGYLPLNGQGDFNSCDWEIIGNRFEHPHLLEQSE